MVTIRSGSGCQRRGRSRHKNRWRRGEPAAHPRYRSSAAELTCGQGVERRSPQCFGESSGSKTPQTSLVKEVANAGEDHGKAEAVTSGDYVVVADGTSWLNKGFGAGFGGFFDSIRKREKCVGGDDTVFKRGLRLHHRDFDRIHAAHLTGTNAESCAAFCKNNRV